MSEEFIKEVDEEIKEEKLEKLWKKLAPYVISLALGIVIFTSVSVWWNSYLTKKKQNLGDDFTAAVQLIEENDFDAAIIALDKVIESSSDGYITLAKLKKASLLIEQNNIKKGLELYIDLEKTAADSAFRDMATLFYVLNAMDVESSDFLLKKIERLTVDNNPWSSTALELKAFLFLKNNNNEKSIEAFEKITKKINVPSDLKGRANDMINFLNTK